MISKMNLRALLLFGILCTSCSKNKKTNLTTYSTDDKLAVVYTTSSNTSHRLRITDTKNFETLNQPFE